MRLAALFGLADGVGFLIGAGLGWAFLSGAVSEVIEIGRARRPRGLPARRRHRDDPAEHPVVHLGAADLSLTVDNLTYGIAGEQTGSLGGEALAQTLSSSMLAYLGLFVAVWLAARASGQDRGDADRRCHAADRGRCALPRRLIEAHELAASLRRAASSTSMRTP